DRNRGLQAAILQLLLLGQHSAAHALSARFPQFSLPGYGRLFAFRVPSTADVAILAEHLEPLTPETHRLLRTDDANREVWMLLGVDEAEDAVPRIQNQLLKVNPRAKATVSQAGPVRNLPSMATATWNAISGSSNHHWIDLSLNALEGRADDIIRLLTEYSSAD